MSDKPVLEQRGMTIVATPVAKSKEDSPLKSEKSGENGPKYAENQQMYLGSLVHLFVQEELGARSFTGMEKYREYLVELGFGQIIDKFSDFARDVKSRVEGDSDPRYKETVWFDELPFLPRPEQVKKIEEFVERIASGRYEGTLKKIPGYENSSVDELVKDFLSDPDFAIRYADDPESRKIDFSGVFALDKDDNHYDSDFLELCSDLGAIASYSYFMIDYPYDSENFTVREYVERHKKYGRVVMGASARPDLLGFAPLMGDHEASEMIDWLESFVVIPREEGDESPELHFGKRHLHDFESYGVKNREMAGEFLNMLAEGRIKYSLIEIKGQFKSEKKGKKVIWQDEVAEGHYQDVSHTLMAMVQWATRMAGKGDEGGLGSSGRAALIEMTKLESREGRVGLALSDKKSIVKIYQQLMKGPHKIYLARLFWPIYNEKKKKQKGGIDLSVESRQEVNVLVPRMLRNHLANIGKSMIGTVLERK